MRAPFLVAVHPHRETGDSKTESRRKSGHLAVSELRSRPPVLTDRQMCQRAQATGTRQQKVKKAS